MAAVDVFAFPSPAEVFWLSLLEPWAAGTPVVATRVGAIPMLETEVGTLVVPIPPDASAEDLAAAVAYAASAEYIALASRATFAWPGRVDVRLGLEADFVPGLEKYPEKQIALVELSHVLGSAHRS